METTNKHNLPPEVVQVLTLDRYHEEGEESWDYSISQLIAPVQQVELINRHKDDLVQRDVIDNFWAFMGSIAHQVLEDAWKEGEAAGRSVVEKRLYKDILGMKISGKPDNFVEPVLRDYKSTKAFNIKKGDHVKWEEQLNCYAYFLRNEGYTVDKIEVVALIFNWDKNKVYEKGYPKAPIVMIDIPLWSEKEQYNFIEKKVKNLKAARLNGLTDEGLAEYFPCSKEEMWQRKKDIAIMKIGGKRAYRTFSSQEEAIEHFMNMKDTSDYEIVERWSERKRCLEFCDCSNHCIQHQRLLAEGK